MIFYPIHYSHSLSVFLIPTIAALTLMLLLIPVVVMILTIFMLSLSYRCFVEGVRCWKWDFISVRLGLFVSILAGLSKMGDLM